MTHTIDTVQQQLTAAREAAAAAHRLGNRDNAATCNHLAALLLGRLCTLRNNAARAAKIEAASTWHGAMTDAEDLAADRAEAAAEEAAAAPILTNHHNERRPS